MKRILTAALLIPVVSYVALWAPEWLFLVVVSIVALLCHYEYVGIVSGHGIAAPGAPAYAAGLCLLLIRREEVLLLLLLVLLVMTLALRFRDLAAGLPAAAAAVFGVLYIFGAWRCGVSLRMASPYWLFFVLVLSWIGDSAAYYIGSALGRHKMAPRLSPAKSWEGAAASLAASLLFGVFYLGWLLPSVTMAQRLVVSAAANAAGQIGDLSESAMKRGAGVKDSSGLLPGHGGWLDRVDSTLFAMPVVYLLLVVLGI